jgi:hypothetical protein
MSIVEGIGTSFWPHINTCRSAFSDVDNSIFGIVICSSPRIHSRHQIGLIQHHAPE